MVSGAEGSSSQTLAEAQLRLTRARIRRGAMEVVARRGFGATVDEIAQVAEVSPRTVFRHYDRHDQLILQAVKDIFDACGRGPVEGLPRSSEDFDGWIEGLATTIHTRNAEILGEAFWDIHATNGDTSGVLAEVSTLRRAARVRGVHYLTVVAWRAVGGEGDPPEDVVLAFALNFSAFATQALMIDFERTPAEIGALTADILKAVLRRAVAMQADAVGAGVEGNG